MQFSLKELESVFNPIKYRKNSSELKDGWEFSFDGESFQPISVPYAPESILSGIGHTDFINECYYKKTFEVKNGEGRVHINFGAVDYIAELYINGRFVGGHRGGYTPFSFDITDYTVEGENELLLKVIDNIENIPFGKQSYKRNSFGCFYTRTTGIWQPVWLEYTTDSYIESFKFYPSFEKSSVDVEIKAKGSGDYSISVFYGDKPVGGASGVLDGSAKISIPLSEKQPWDVLDGRLYDVVQIGRAHV